MFKIVDREIFWTKQKENLTGIDILVGTVTFRDNRSVLVFTEEFRARLLNAASTAGLLWSISVLEELREFLLVIEKE